MGWLDDCMTKTESLSSAGTDSPPGGGGGGGNWAPLPQKKKKSNNNNNNDYIYIFSKIVSHSSKNLNFLCFN